MILHRRNLLNFVLLSACACGLERFAHAQTPKKEKAVPPLEKWKVSDPPRELSDELTKYNNYGTAWQVFIKNGRVGVRPEAAGAQKTVRLPFDFIRVTVGQEPKTKPGTCLCNKKYVVKVADGWLRFANAGEWGGRVDWFSPDGVRHYKISIDQVSDYAQTPAGLFAVQGLAHLSSSRGTFLRFEQNAAGKWQSRTIVDLESAPYSLLTETGGTFLIVTGDRLIRVHPADKTVTQLAKANFWNILYPNSLVAAPNGDFYIGMLGGVVRLEKANGAYKVRWLTPPA